MNENSDTPSLQKLTGALIRNTCFTEVGATPIEELQLQLGDNADKVQITYILREILSYPSSELAVLHEISNRLGSLDLKDDHQNKLNESELKELGKQSQFCTCCGFIKQENTIKLCTSIKNLNNIGLSTYLYFQTLLNLIFLLIIAFFFYCIFSLITNIMASDEYQVNYWQELRDNGIPDLQKYRSFQGLLVLSLGSKQLNSSQRDKYFYTAQCWIGLAMIIIWGCFFINIKYREKVGTLDLMHETKSAADFSISIENIPTDMTQNKLQEQLSAYREEIQKMTQSECPQFKIVKFNLAKPFYLDESKFKDERLLALNQRYQELKEMFIQWIQYRMDHDQFQVQKNQREAFYQEFQQLQQDRVKMFIEITQGIKTEIEANEQEPTTVAFVTFGSSKSKEFIVEHHEEDFADKVRNFFTCKKDHKHLYLADLDGNQVKAYIKQAPEPEDIIWSNLGQQKWQLRRKKLITFIVTALLLGISFAVIFGLSKAQIDYSTSAKHNSYLSFLISLVISVFNIIIQQLLRRLTLMERNYTTTMQQASLGIKAVLALLINSILIPILVNYYFKQGNLYGVNGLAYDVFLLGITNSYLSPILKIFDFYYFFTRVLRWLYGRPAQRLAIDQKELNQFYEHIQFQAGYEYIYVVNLFLFTCFFMPLQPIIVLFAISGLGLMFWAQKYSLYNRCRRPVPGNKAINTTMYTLIYLGPLFFGIGSFCWSHFFQPNFIGIAPNLTTCIVAFIIFILPYRWLVRKFLGELETQDMSYLENRIYLPSEYDRLNPSTSQAAVKEYIEFVEQFKRSMARKSKGEIEQIQKGLFKQISRGRKNNNQNQFEALLGGVMGSGKAAHDNANILSSLVGTDNNVNNQLMLANALLGNDSTNNINIMVQNWGDLAGKNQKQMNPFLKMTESSMKKKENLQEAGFINLFDHEQSSNQQLHNLPPHQRFAPGPQQHLFHQQPLPNRNINPFNLGGGPWGPQNNIFRGSHPSGGNPYYP